MTQRNADFMREPHANLGAVRFALMIRWGSWMLNNRGLHRWRQITSVNGKITRYDWIRVL